MAVTREQVLEIARLARLRLSEEETRVFTAQLDAILEHVADLDRAVPGDHASAGYTPAGRAPLRSDEPGADPLHLPLAAMAPDWQAGFFAVPRLPAMDGGAEADAGS